MTNKSKPKIVNIILIIILILLIGYIAVDKYLDARQKQRAAIFQQGIQAGYEQAVTQLVQQALTCQPVPVTLQNQTINMIAVQCLQQD